MVTFASNYGKLFYSIGEGASMANSWLNVNVYILVGLGFIFL